MKFALFLMLALTTVSSFAFAADDAHTMVAASKHKSITGMVKSISQADAAKGTKSEIVITSAGQDESLLVRSTTTLYDADAKAITLDKIKANAKVTAAYKTTPEGVKEAKSIKLEK
jgi:hypothetical protein